MGNNKKTASESAADCARVHEIITANPASTVKSIAEQMGRAKSTIYQHIATLLSTGKISSQCIPLANGGYGKLLAYSAAESEEAALNKISRFDYPNQATVAAIDKAKDIPAMDPLTAALFGRMTKETA